jgi:hypothetical protein
MHRLSFFAALALVFGSTQTLACQNANCANGDERAPAECNGIGCVRPHNALEKLVKTAEHTFSVMRVAEPGNALGLCGTGNCATQPTATPLPKHCGSAGCASSEPKARAAPATGNGEASIDASTLVTDAFAALAERPVRLPPAVSWAEWADQWGSGGMYKSSIGIKGHRF